MTTHRLARPRISALLLGMVVAATATAPAAAQSPNELRRENQRLRTELDQANRALEAARTALDSARAERDQLRALVAQLQAGGSTTAPSGPGSPPSGAAPATGGTAPDANPLALFHAIKTSYDEMAAELELGTEPRDPRRVVYVRRVDRWVRRVNREHKSSIEWTVRAPALPAAYRRGVQLSVQAVDPETDRELGTPFDIDLTRPMHTRLRQLEERTGLDDVLVLRGVLTPEVRFNRDREVVGPFDNPPFIGPFAEFGFTVQATSLVARPAKTKDAKPAEAKRAAGESSGPDR